MVERIELGDGDVAPSVLRRAADLLGIDRAIVPSGNGASSPSPAQSFLLITYFVNALGEEYHGYLTAIAAPTPGGYLVHAPLEGELVVQTTDRVELMQAAMQRIQERVIEAGAAGTLPALLADQGVPLYRGAPPGSKRQAPPRPDQGWSIQVTPVAA